MDISIFEKFKIIFNYIGSSFVSIGLLVIFTLLLILLLLTIKYKNKTFNVLLLGGFIGTILGIVLSHSDYVSYCFKSLIKMIMNYIYFPSPVVYFFIVLFMLIACIRTLFSDISIIKKVINYIFTSIIYFLFFLFIVRVTMNGIVLMDLSNVYNDEVILSIVQISNLLFVIWIIVTGFYKLYNFYKKKFD